MECLAIENLLILYRLHQKQRTEEEIHSFLSERQWKTRVLTVNVIVCLIPGLAEVVARHLKWMIIFYKWEDRIKN